MTNEMMDLRSGIRHAKLIAAWRRKSHPAKVTAAKPGRVLRASR